MSRILAGFVCLWMIAGCAQAPAPPAKNVGQDKSAVVQPPDDQPSPADPPSQLPPDEPEPPTKIASEPPDRKSPVNVDRGFTRIRIAYATDRQRGTNHPNEFFSDRRQLDSAAQPLQFGQCEVSIPYRHQPGEIERPSLWKLEIHEHPAKHIVLLAVHPMQANEFREHLRQSVSASESKAALLFVHGFNVTFAEAARRTAQMKYDLGFDGAAVMYTWPAPGNYIECEGNVTWTRPHLMEFLREYLEQSGAEKIHLIAHSMGTRILTDALRELVQTRGDRSPKYNQIILAAPDIDASVFKTQIAPRIVDTAERISIYSSSADLAIVASKKAHNYVRLGEAGSSLTLFPEFLNIEVLDATDINESLLGHGYYGDSPRILYDVRMVLVGKPAVERRVKPQTHHYRLLP
jgi:esterase/lipase superfamily enzyme